MTTYEPNQKRYEGATFRRCGKSGLVLPAISLGFWQNFGGHRRHFYGTSALFRTLRVRNLELANRIVIAPMCHLARAYFAYPLSSRKSVQVAGSPRCALTDGVAPLRFTSR